MTRDEAISILEQMEGGNVHGTGCGWINSEGKIQIQKYPISLQKILKNKNGKNFLSHLPHNGWTIAHLRMASCGTIEHKNCHPFNINDKMVGCHNGCFSPWYIPKMILEKYDDFSSTTDTEVALRLINLLGYKACLQNFNNDGIFFCLTKHGVLNVLKSSGDMHITAYGKVGEKSTYLISSELDKLVYPERMSGIQGWYKFNPDGTFNKFVEKEFKFSSEFTGSSVFKKRDLDLDSPPMEKTWSNPMGGYYGGDNDWRRNGSTHAAGGSSSHLPAIYRPPEHGGNPNLLAEQTESWSSD